MKIPPWHVGPSALMCMEVVSNGVLVCSVFGYFTYLHKISLKKIVRAIQEITVSNV